MRALKALWAVGLGIGVSVLGGCASTPAYQAAFGPKNQLSGNTQVLAGSGHVVFRAILATLTSHGFAIQSADVRDGLISAVGHMPDPRDADVSYKIETSVSVTRLGSDQSRVGVAASETKVLHQKTHTYFHLLWLVPIFPTGTQYNTVDRGSGTIRDAHFYQVFFQDVKTSVRQMERPRAVLRAAAAAPTIAIESLTPVTVPVVTPLPGGATAASSPAAPRTAPPPASADPYTAR